MHHLLTLGSIIVLLSDLTRLIYKSYAIKTILLFTSIMMFIANTHAQNQTEKQDLKSYYLQKSKNAKTAGWVCLGLGTGMEIAGIAIANNDKDSWVISDEAGYLILGGVVVDLVSIPFFVSAGNHKKFAARISVNEQGIYQLQNNLATAKHQSAIMFKVNF